MKIIQSFWSRPSLNENSIGSDSRNLGGWNKAIQYYISWSLSCFKLLEFYKDVELYTDKAGKELLIDKLNLPYTKVHIVLDNLNSFDSQLWTLGKIYAYSLQKEPFLHVDSDIYIWKSFSHRIINAEIIAQNLESNHAYYNPIVQSLNHFKFPGWIKEELKRKKPILVSNTGIVGGRNHEFIRNYADIALKMISDNTLNLNQVNIGGFSVLMEQFLLYLLAKIKNRTIEYLVSEQHNYLNDNILFKVQQTPNRIKYIHPLSTFKRNPQVENLVEMSLRFEYPKTYYKIKKLVEVEMP